MNQVNVNQAPPKVTGQQSVFNNDMAKAYASGDPRFNVKQYDRPGMSRAGAQWNQAGIDAANNMSSGIASAYGNLLQNNANAANTALQGAAGREKFGQALNGLTQQAAYQQAMSNLTRQQQGIGLLGMLLS
jgi:hypothetical protein